MNCYITSTGAYLPGAPVTNDCIHDFLGTLEGEVEVAKSVLAMNGIVQRYYAQNANQQPTHDVYELAAAAAQACLAERAPLHPVSFLTAGATYAPLSGPGIASLVHHRLQEKGLLEHPVEISSHGGICTSASAP